MVDVLALAANLAPALLLRPYKDGDANARSSAPRRATSKGAAFDRLAAGDGGAARVRADETLFSAPGSPIEITTALRDE